MGYETPDDVLAHFGVKGMKWGQHLRRKTPEPGSEDHEKAASIRTTAKESGTKALSNEELQHAITRLNLERQFSTLTAEKGKIEKGLSFVKSSSSNAKTVVDAVQTTQKTYDTIKPLLDAAIKAGAAAA